MERVINVAINVSPQEAAKVFCEFDADQQAKFFNHIAHVVGATWDFPFVNQLQAISDCGLLYDEGRVIMRQIGEYAEQGETT